MSAWYYAVTQDFSKFPSFIVYFENELVNAKLELSLKGRSIEKHAAELPGIVETRFSQLQEIEAILEYLNIQLRKDRSVEFKKFLELYNRALSSRDVEKYVDGVQTIVDLNLLINEIALLRNKFLGVIKSLETKNYMISNITKLKVVGLDDASI